MSPSRRPAHDSSPSLVRNAQLRAFHAVATHRGFTDAARALGVSQPAVSMQVRSLERAYGVELFRRSHAGVALTELGAALLDRVRPMFTLEAEAGEILGAASGLLRGALRVGADAPFLVLKLLARFRDRHPALDVSLTLGNATETLADLLESRTDVAFVSDRNDDPRLFAAPVARSHQVVVVASTHPWAKRRQVRLGELDGVTMISREEGSGTRRAFDRAVARAGVRPRLGLVLGSREAVLEAVAEGLGVAAVIESERGQDARVVALSIADAAIEHVEYVVCLHERRRLRAIAAFLEGVPRLERKPRKKA
jgi:aminoethylphosphonate catabolism LysR family transcriptional regulator